MKNDIELALKYLDGADSNLFLVVCCAKDLGSNKEMCEQTKNAKNAIDNIKKILEESNNDQNR